MKGKECLFLSSRLLIVTLFSTVFQLYHDSQCTYPCFSGLLLTSNPYNILSKSLAAFPHNRCQNNGQWLERNEFCRNDYHQSTERILAEPGIRPATSCSQVRSATNWAMGLGTRFSKDHAYFNTVIKTQNCVLNSWDHHIDFFPILQAQSKPDYSFPAIWPKKNEQNVRNFTEEQLQAGQQIIGLQYGSNKGASQAGMNFGKARMIIDWQFSNHILC